MSTLEKIEFFDRCASDWDKNQKKALSVKLKKIIKIADIQRGEKVLDVGCGTGILLPLLKERVGAKGKVVALDFSFNMLKRAQEKFGEEFQYIQADIENMPLEDASFHKIISFNSFPHFLNKENALCEIWRVLKAGGSLLIAHATSRKKVNSFHRKVGGAVRNDVIPNDRRMIGLLRKTGFTNIKINDIQNFYSLFAAKILEE